MIGSQLHYNGMVNLSGSVKNHDVDVQSDTVAQGFGSLGSRPRFYPP